MAGKVIMDNCSVNNVGTVFSVPEGADVEIRASASTFMNCGTMYEVRDARIRIEEAISKLPEPQRSVKKLAWDKAWDAFVSTGSGLAATAIAHGLGIG